MARPATLQSFTACAAYVSSCSARAWGAVEACAIADCAARMNKAAQPRSVLPMLINDHFLVCFHPGPRITRPGFAPVCVPFLTTAAPLTKTCVTPVEYWCGFSNVALSLLVAGAKPTTSAENPGLSAPRCPRFGLGAGGD